MVSFGVLGAIFVLVVAFINLIPVAYELILSVLLSRGYKLNLTRITNVGRFLNRFGLLGEYGLVVVVFLLIFGAIYLHAFVYYPILHLHHTDSWLNWIFFHLFPSVYLNASMIYNFYKSTRRISCSTLVARA